MERFGARAAISIYRNGGGCLQSNHGQGTGGGVVSRGTLGLSIATPDGSESCDIPGSDDSGDQLPCARPIFGPPCRRWLFTAEGRAGAAAAVTDRWGNRCAHLIPFGFCGRAYSAGKQTSTGISVR